MLDAGGVGGGGILGSQGSRSRCEKGPWANPHRGGLPWAQVLHAVTEGVPAAREGGPLCVNAGPASSESHAQHRASGLTPMNESSLT